MFRISKDKGLLEAKRGPIAVDSEKMGQYPGKLEELPSNIEQSLVLSVTHTPDRTTPESQNRF
jgi:hypothetical protein